MKGLNDFIMSSIKMSDGLKNPETVVTVNDLHDFMSDKLIISTSEHVKAELKRVDEIEILKSALETIRDNSSTGAHIARKALDKFNGSK